MPLTRVQQRRVELVAGMESEDRINYIRRYYRNSFMGNHRPYYWDRDQWAEWVDANIQSFTTYRTQCECRCGGETTYGRQFLPGHNTRLLYRLVQEQAWDDLEMRGWDHLTEHLKPREATTAFGFEAEFFGPQDFEAERAVQAAGVSVENDGYHHRAVDYWRITEDGSVHGSGLELVSPILKMEDDYAWTDSLNAIRAIRDVGGRIDASCGLHVHHNAQYMNRDEVMRVADLYYQFQDTINTMLPRSRRMASYARSMNAEYCQRAKDLTDPSNTRTNYGRRWKPRLNSLDRYYAVNLQAINVHGTIEFRQHSGTLNYDKVSMWVRFTKLFMDMALEKESVEAAQHLNDGTIRGMITFLGGDEAMIQFYENRAQNLATDMEDVSANVDDSPEDDDEPYCDYCEEYGHYESDCETAYEARNSDSDIF